MLPILEIAIYRALKKLMYYIDERIPKPPKIDDTYGVVAEHHDFASLLKETQRRGYTIGRITQTHCDVENPGGNGHITLHRGMIPPPNSRDLAAIIKSAEVDPLTHKIVYRLYVPKGKVP